jgi:hypothetical protein
MSDDKELQLPPNNRTVRRNVRYRLFRIREGNDVVQDDLKEHIETQFQFGMSWKTFTFTWDVDPNHPLEVIIEDEWDEKKGGYDRTTGVKSPPAFTHQE